MLSSNYMKNLKRNGKINHIILKTLDELLKEEREKNTTEEAINYLW